MKPIEQFIKAQAIKFSAEEVGDRPDGDEWSRDSRHFKCKISKGRRSMTLYYSQGPAITREPSIEDVLDCVASDAAGYVNARTFEGWAGEYGYDTDSRRAERTYLAIGRQVAALRRVLNSDLALNELLFETERL